MKKPKSVMQRVKAIQNAHVLQHNKGVTKHTPKYGNIRPRSKSR